MNLQAIKKELGHVESVLDQGMNEYSEEQASMLRLNMAIVEERTCQWSLFQVLHTNFIFKTLPHTFVCYLLTQRGLRDLEDAVRDDNNVTEFNTIIETHKISRDYIEKYQKITAIDDRENFCLRLR